MEPIINPMIFYWLDIINGLDITMAILAVITGSTFIVSMICFITSRMEDNDYSQNSPSYSTILAKKWAIASGIGVFIFTVFIIAIPNENTCYKMLIAKYLTKENLTVTAENLKKAVDYIVSAIERIK